jgi:hypothetical protein
MTTKTTAPALTVEDIEAAYQNDGWLGFGYLGGRQSAREAIASGEWTIDNIAEADALALRIANEKGWTAERFFEWMNAKLGRWFADVMLGGELSEQDLAMAEGLVR